MYARERRRQKSERRRLREAREGSDGKASGVNIQRTNTRDHPVPFLYPIPLYYAPVGGCVVGVGGIMGGASLMGAQCASVRRLFMLALLGCLFTGISRVLGVAVASELSAVGCLRVAVVAEAEGVAGAEVAVEAGVAVEAEDVVEVLNQTLDAYGILCSDHGKLWGIQCLENSLDLLHVCVNRHFLSRASSTSLRST